MKKKISSSSLSEHKLAEHKPAEHRRATEALAEVAQRYRKLFESNPHPMWVYDLETLAFLAVNDAAVAHYGYSREEFLSMTIRDIRPPEDIPRLLDNVSHATVTGGLDRAGVWRHIKKDGTVIDVEIVSHTQDFGGRQAEMVLATDITDRLRAEEELRAERDRFRSYMDVSGVMFLVIDAGQKVSMINRKGCEILGYTEHELIGADWFDTCLPVNEREQARQVFLNLIAGQGDAVEYFENPVLTKSGEERMIAWHNWMLKNGEGGVVATLSSGEDITEKMRTEQALRQSRRDLRAIIDTEPECVKVIDAEGRILDINPAGAAMIEADNPGIISGVSIYSFIAPEHVEAVKRLVDSVFRGASDSLEFDAIGLKGTRKCLETHAVPLRDDHGKVTSLLSITRDITEWKKTVEALKQEKQRLEDVTTYANCGLLMHDENLKVIYANRVAQEWFGPLEAMRGRHCWEFFCLSDPEHECAGLRVARTGEVARSATFTRVINGVERSFYVIASPLKDRQGKVVQITEVIVDVTERKHLEEQLLHMQKMESLGQLASGIAHDFNNVLGGILGYADLGLMKIDESHYLHEDLLHIAELARKAAGITRQLLAFSRRQVLEQKDVDLNALVANLLRLLGKTLGEHIEIDFIPGQPLDTVYADPVQMEQVLMNLCVNARDAMPAGGKLTIRTCNETLDEGSCRTYTGVVPGKYVLLSVADTGVGIDAAVRERMFEPFFTTKETGRGTGLGLSIVYGIVGQHKGCIDVESEEGKGTTFNVYLPTTGASSTLVQGKAAPAIRGGIETILLVEDEAGMRKLLCHVLKEYGYTVVCAVNGEEGLELYDKHASSISLVVSDLVMPRMSGMALYQRVRAIAPAVKFLFVSGYVPEEERQRLIEGEKADLMYKPFGSSEFAVKVREILDRSASEE